MAKTISGFPTLCPVLCCTVATERRPAPQWGGATPCVILDSAVRFNRKDRKEHKDRFFQQNKHHWIAHLLGEAPTVGASMNSLSVIFAFFAVQLRFLGLFADTRRAPQVGAPTGMLAHLGALTSTDGESESAAGSPAWENAHPRNPWFINLSLRLRLCRAGHSAPNGFVQGQNFTRAWSPR